MEFPQPEPTEDRRRRMTQAVLVRTGDLIAVQEEDLNRMDPQGLFGTEMVEVFAVTNRTLDTLPQDASSGEILRRAGSEIAAHAPHPRGALFGIMMETIGAHLGNGPNDIFTILRAHQEALHLLQLRLLPTSDEVSLLSVLEPFVASLGKAARSGATLNRGWQLALGDAELAQEELTASERQTADACIMYFLLRSTGEVLESSLPDYI